MFKGLKEVKHHNELFTKWLNNVLIILQMIILSDFHQREAFTQQAQIKGLKKDVTPSINGWVLKFKITNKIYLIHNQDEKYQMNCWNMSKIIQKAQSGKMKLHSLTLKIQTWGKFVEIMHKIRRKVKMSKILLLYGNFLQDKMNKMSLIEEILKVK